MGRETVVLGAFAVALALAALHLARQARRCGSPGIGRQLVFGLCCGLLGAVAAAVPYADVVPDRLEPTLLGVVAVAAVVWSTVLLGKHRRAGRHRGRQELALAPPIAADLHAGGTEPPPLPRRTPGASLGPRRPPRPAKRPPGAPVRLASAGSVAMDHDPASTPRPRRGGPEVLGAARRAHPLEPPPGV